MAETELEELREDLKRIKEESSPRRYVYVPRERKIQKFTGLSGKVEEFVDELRSVMSSRNMTDVEVLTL